MPIEYRRFHTPKRDSGGVRSPAKTTYFAFDPHSKRDLGLVEVEHHDDTQRANDNPPDKIRYPKDYNTNPNAETSRQGRLFANYGQPAHHKLAMMAGTMGGNNTTAMSLMALAHQDATESGLPLIPDQSLTRDSHRVVRHLAKFGVVDKRDVPKRATVQQGRVMPLFSNYMHEYDGNEGVEAIHPDVVREARNTLVGRVRRGKEEKAPKTKRGQPIEGQQSLFGEDQS
jgi:hypothetical protein